MNNFSRTPEHLSASFVSFIASIASHHAGGFAQSMMAQARRQTCRSGVTAHCSAAHRPGSTSRAQTSPSPPARSLLLVPLPLDDLRHRKAKTSAFGRVAAEAQAKASAFGRAAAEAQAQAASLSLSRRTCILLRPGGGSPIEAAPIEPRPGPAPAGRAAGCKHIDYPQH